MELFSPPAFFREFVCIADDPALAALFSSLVGEHGAYVAVLAGPRMERSDKRNEVVRRCNSVAKLSPKSLLLAGLPTEAVSEIARLMGEQFAVLQAGDVDGVLDAVDSPQRRHLDGEIHCQLIDVGPALLQAKRQNKLLRVDATAARFARVETTGASHVVVVDDHDPLIQVIAANYAYSIGADLAMIAQRDDNLRDQVYAEIDARGAFRGNERGARAQACLTELRNTLEPSLQFGPREFVTFVTRGIPYGYFYRDVASTHLLSSAWLGETINAAIYWSTNEPYISGAVLIDPGFFDSSETASVSTALESDGVCVFPLLGEDANIENTEMFLRTFPYDLLFICSHCGEVGGQRLTIRVPDAGDSAHLVEIDEVLQVGSARFSSQPDDFATVHQFLTPVSINGVDWHHAGPELKRHYEAIWKYLQSTSRDQWDIVRQVVVEHVMHSTAIQLAGGALMLNMQQSLDPQVSPIIFNNSCVSFYDAARALTFAGARAYIGTLTPVETMAAQHLAEQLFSHQERGLSLPAALAESQVVVFDNPDDRTYVHVGCHFEAIRPPVRPAMYTVRRRINVAITTWESQLDKVAEKTKDNVSAAIRFLSLFQ